MDNVSVWSLELTLAKMRSNQRNGRLQLAIPVFIALENVENSSIYKMQLKEIWKPKSQVLGIKRKIILSRFQKA